MSRSFHPRCGVPKVPAGGDPERVCFVCHGYIPVGQSIGVPHIQAMVCGEPCADVVGELGRVKEGSGQGRWRPRNVVRALADGARCPRCKAVSK